MITTTDKYFFFTIKFKTAGVENIANFFGFIKNLKWSNISLFDTNA